MNIFGRIKMAVKMGVVGWKGKGYDFSSWYGRTFWGIDNSGIATNETVFSVISRLANTVSSLPLKIYKDYDHPMIDAADVIINNPNENMTGMELFNKLEVSRNETGNAYAIIFRDMRYKVEKIVPIKSQKVTAFINQDDGELWYRVLGKKTHYIHNMDMLHFKHISGTGQLEGISPLKVLSNTIKFDKAVQEFSLSEMEKKESFILKYATSVDGKKRAAIIENFRRFYKENGGALFQEPGVEINNIERKYFSADTLASERITRSRVANVFNVPVSFLNDAEGGTFTSNEQMMIQFVQMTLTPIIRQYEHELNRKLLTQQERKAGFYFKFNIGALLRGDTAARTAFYQMMIRSGGMKPNEVRQLEDLPPVEGKAGELWISGDLYPIDLPVSERKSTKLKGCEENEE